MKSADPRRTLRRLTFIVAVQWTGATLGLPLLPVYLEGRGGSPAVVGLVMSSFFVAGLATQFIVGHLSDRFGRRQVLVAGLVAFSVASAFFVLPLSAPWYALARAFQGAGAGAIEVASLSTVSALFSEAERGRAISKVFSAQLAGIALGPVIGSFVPLSHLGWAYVFAAVLSAIACVPALSSDLGDKETERLPLEPIRWSKQLIGSITGSLAGGLCIGVYEACWSLLMRSHHASSLQIRLSWTLFAIPFALLAPVGGWLADHGNRRVIAQFGMFNSALFLFIYPHIHSNVMLLALGPFESIGAALSLPSISSMLTQHGSPREMGRRQGLSTSANTAALAASAAVAGALFSIKPSLPFTLIAVVSAVLTSTIFYWWHGIKGHVTAVTES